MHIDETTHEHGSTGKVYRYEADYSVSDSSVDWTGEVQQGDDFRQTLRGSIPITFASAPAMAEMLVRDAIVKQIDTQQG